MKKKVIAAGLLILVMVLAYPFRPKKPPEPKPLYTFEVFLEPAQELFGRDGALYINGIPAIVFNYTGMVPPLSKTSGTYRLKAHVEGFKPEEQEVVIEEGSNEAVRVFFHLEPVE